MARPGYNAVSAIAAGKQCRVALDVISAILVASDQGWTIMTLVRDAGRSPPRWGKIALIVVAVILAIPLFSPIFFRALLFQPFYIPDSGRLDDADVAGRR